MPVTRGTLTANTESVPRVLQEYGFKKIKAKQTGLVSWIFCDLLFHAQKKKSYKTELPKMAQQRENGTVTSSEEKTKLSWHKTGHPGPRKNYRSRKRLQEPDGSRAGLERWGRGCGCHQV